MVAPSPLSEAVAARRRVLRGLVAGLSVPVWSQAWAQTDEDGELFAKIMASGVLKVAIYKDDAPYSYVDGGEVKGLDADIAKALARNMGLGVQFLPFDAGEDMSADLRWMVEKGHYLGFGPADLMMRVPVDRHLMFLNRKVLILSPYMSERPVLVLNTDKVPQLRLADDLKGLPLVGEKGTGLTSAMLGYGGGLLKEQVKIVSTGAEAVRMVARGEAVATYVTRAVAESALHGLGQPSSHIELMQMDMGTRAAQGWPIGVAIRAVNHPLRAAVEQAMAKLQGSGELLTIFQAHHLTFTTP